MRPDPEEAVMVGQATLKNTPSRSKGEKVTGRWLKAVQTVQLPLVNTCALLE